MPRPTARSPRIAAAFRVLCAGLWLAACSGGGSGGGSGASAGSTASPAAETTSVTIAWAGAQGPVAGYSIYVQRGDADFKHEADVSQPRATLHGASGSTARVIVVAFDGAHAHGPSSPTSARFTFPAANASSAGASAASAGSTNSALASAQSPAAPISDPVGSSDPDPDSTSTSTPDPALAGGVLVWQSGDAFRLTNAAIETTRLFTRPDEMQLAGVADFDADGQGDLLWRSATSELAYMPGSVLRGSGPVSLISLGTMSPSALVVGAGDFDGNGYGDVLLSAAGGIRARLTRPGAAPASADLGTAAQAVLVGIADFDANGSDDIAWRATTGALVIWLVDGGQASAIVELALDLDVIGIGDLDGDGAAELAVRGGDGSVHVVHPLAALPQLEATDLANATEWAGAGAVDLESDGSEELVLVTAEAIRFAGLTGDQVIGIDPQSPWQLTALLP